MACNHSILYSVSVPTVYCFLGKTAFSSAELTTKLHVADAVTWRLTMHVANSRRT